MIRRTPPDLKKSLNNNPVVSALLNDWHQLNLPDCWLAAGVVAQSYWNTAHDFPALYGVDDIDIVYFDPDDLSEELESHRSTRIRRVFEHLPVRLDVKNQARVHLWYEGKFGYAIDPYRSAPEAIDTFPTTAGAIGIRPYGRTIESYASFGFDDLLKLIVRPNKRQITRSIYEEKVARWNRIWPMLRIVGWDDA